MTIDDFTGFARSLAEETAPILRQHFADPGLRIDRKDDASPVTAADRAIEDLVRRRIRAAFPGEGILGEEEGLETGSASNSWILDPIDGTRSFAAGCPLFATLLGYLENGRPRFGAVFNPLLDLFCVGDGRTTRIDGREARIRTGVPLPEATLLTTDLFSAQRHQDGAAFEALLREAGMVRTWGDCFGYMLLVRGGADVMLDPIMNAWDLLPLVPILEGAGVVLSDWQGGDCTQGTSLVAASPDLHPTIIRRLNPASG